MDVHLVDGTYELFRSFYGAPPSKSPDGIEVGAVRGLLRSISSLIKKDGATHVAAAFDTVIESFRNELFDGYKTSEGIDPALFNQFGLAEKALSALGVVVWPMQEFEADDALATAAHQLSAQKTVDNIYICSPDKDLMQCVNKSVLCLDRRRKITYDEQAVEEKLGVTPPSIPDFLALVGDQADGIPGIPRWGAKSTATILQTYKHIEAIPLDVSQWTVKVRGQKTLSETLNSQKEDALLFKKLATLRTDAPINTDLQMLAYKGANKDQLFELCQQIGDTSFFEQTVEK